MEDVLDKDEEKAISQFPQKPTPGSDFCESCPQKAVTL